MHTADVQRKVGIEPHLRQQVLDEVGRAFLARRVQRVRRQARPSGGRRRRLGCGRLRLRQWAQAEEEPHRRVARDLATGSDVISLQAALLCMGEP